VNDAPPRILHLHSGFNLGGKEARAVRLMNLWGTRAHHTVVSADHAAMGARSAIAQAVPCDFPTDGVPSLRGRPGLRRYARWARYMRGFDLVLTYNWGAMDAVMAHRLLASTMHLPPLIHHEDGFNEDEAERLKHVRNHFRRLALAGAAALVVPSERLRRIALDVWKQPERRVHHIPNGIDVDLYAVPPLLDAIPGLVREANRIVVGTLAGLRAVKNLPRLVRAAAPLSERARLVIVGEGPARAAILAEARRLGSDAPLLPGFIPNPWNYVGLFDIFALSSDSEQCPISLIEAMAAGLPVAATGVGDIAAMVAEDNAPFIVPPGDERALAAAIARLASDPALRRHIGHANRLRAAALFREADMVARYAALYERAMGRPGAFFVGTGP